MGRGQTCKTAGVAQFIYGEGWPRINFALRRNAIMAGNVIQPVAFYQGLQQLSAGY